MINSHALCQLSYRGIFDFSYSLHSPIFPSCLVDDFPANWAIEEYFVFFSLNTKDNDFSVVIFSIYSFRQLSTFPGSHPPSIIDVKELNFCVRYGNRWILLAIVTESVCVTNTNICNVTSRVVSLALQNIGNSIAAVSDVYACIMCCISNHRLEVFLYKAQF